MLPIGLITAGLQMLPKIPAMWDSIAGVFGKEVPTSVKQAGDLVNTIVGQFKDGQVPPEQKMALEMAMMEHEEEIERLKLERRKAEIEEAKHQRDTQVTLWGAEQQSQSNYVRETRPKILRQMWYFIMFYGTFCPLILLNAGWLGLATVTIMTGFMKSFGGWLLGTFGTAFVGYAVARTVDKKNPEAKDQDNVLGKALNLIL